MSALALVSIVVAVLALFIVITPILRSYLRYRGTRLVTCPETKKPAAVEADAFQVAFLDSAAQKLRLKECSRWPERADCGQECLQEIEAAPEDCLVRTIVTKWYEGRQCALCGKAIGKIDWLEHKPGLLGPDRKTELWSQFRAETLPEVMSTHQPVCWDCHIAASFRNQFPDLVIDRPRKKH
jgi:hypothetical protein